MKKLSDMDFFKSRKVRIWSAVIAILLFLAGTAFLIGVLSYEMVTANPRFVIRHVRVSSQDHGFWKGRKDLICDILQIREGSTNMFNLDPGKMRRRLLEREPSIQSVRIIRGQILQVTLATVSAPPPRTPSADGKGPPARNH